MTKQTNHTIKNRHNLNLAITVDENTPTDKLIIHGLGGSKDQPHMRGIREAFVEAGYMVVAIDATHAFGASGGNIQHVTPTSYIEDLEDAIAWAQTQKWYKEPFALAGHSLGGITVLHYTFRNPERVAALLPMSTLVSGKLWLEKYQRKDKAFLDEWKAAGSYYKESKSMPGKSGYVSYGLMEDAQKYNTLQYAPYITCPTLLMVGDEDDTTTPAMHKLLYDKLAEPKELQLLEGVSHTPEGEGIARMKQGISAWLNR